MRDGACTGYRVSIVACSLYDRINLGSGTSFATAGNGTTVRSVIRISSRIAAETREIRT